LIQSVAREHKSDIKKERDKERVVLKRRKLAFKVFANSVYGSYVMHNSESVFETLLII
jgi:DNA polymerase elongation subunit (family B)